MNKRVRLMARRRVEKGDYCEAPGCTQRAAEVVGILQTSGRQELEVRCSGCAAEALSTPRRIGTELNWCAVCACLFDSQGGEAGAVCPNCGEVMPAIPA